MQQNEVKLHTTVHKLYILQASNNTLLYTQELMDPYPGTAKKEERN